VLTRENFSTQFLRWVVATNQDFIISDNIEIKRLFQCLNSYVKLSSSSIIKNHMMKRLKEIEAMLFEHLSHLMKISLTLNCWSVSNRQSYLFVIAFFIDKNWNYHEIIIEFEYMKKKHIEENLFKMIENVLKKHKIIDRILTVIIDNASNNTTFFYCLMKNISNITKCVDIIFENDDEDSENNEIDLLHVSCLTHVLQLTLQTFLDFVRVNSINDELQKNWYEQENINVIKRADKDLSMILTKIIVILSNFNLLNVIRFS
jgi:hypothetical protein